MVLGRRRIFERIYLLESKQLKLSYSLIVHIEQKMLFKLLRGFLILEWQRGDWDCLLQFVTHLDIRRQRVAVISIPDEHEANEIFIFLNDLVD